MLGRQDIALWLLEHGADPDLPDGEGCTPYFFAVFKDCQVAWEGDGASWGYKIAAVVVAISTPQGASIWWGQVLVAPVGNGPSDSVHPPGPVCWAGDKLRAGERARGSTRARDRVPIGYLSLPGGSCRTERVG